MISSDAKNDSDAEFNKLAKMSQEGDRVAYGELLSSLIPVLNRFLAGKAPVEDREDIVQNVLISTHQALHTYDPGRPFLVWFYAIARFKLIDYYRKESSLAKIVEKVGNEIKFFTNQLGMQEELISLGDLICKLPPKQERVIRLMKLESLSIKEVSKITGMSESAVKVTAHRGYKKLKELATGMQKDEARARQRPFAKGVDYY